ARSHAGARLPLGRREPGALLRRPPAGARLAQPAARPRRARRAGPQGARRVRLIGEAGARPARPARRAGPRRAPRRPRRDHRPAARLLRQAPVAAARAVAEALAADAGRARAADLPQRQAAPSLPDALGSDGQPRGPRSAGPHRARPARRANRLRTGVVCAPVTVWFWRAAWLLLPAAWLVHHFAHADVATFVISCLSLIPFARTMGDATEDLSERLGPAAGSLLNATFGNAAELILAIAALRHGHVALVKGSVTGSILGNLLLVA